MVYSEAGKQTSFSNLFLFHSLLQCCSGVVRSCNNLVISKFLQNDTAVLVRKSKSVKENFAKSKCYCLGKEIGSRTLWRHKRQCLLLHSATFTPKGWWGPQITVCISGQPTQGDLLSSCLADRNSQCRGQCTNITPVTHMRTDNARKTWGHSGQFDVYWLPAPVLNFVTENMDLKCVPKSREMSSKKTAFSKCKERSLLAE